MRWILLQNIVFRIRLTVCTSLCHFEFQFIFFFDFSNCTKSGAKTDSGTKTDTLKKITRNVQNWYLFAVFTNIHVSFSITRRHYVHCIHVSSRVDFVDRSQKMQRMFLFVGGAFPMTVSESPSLSESALLCKLESLSLFFDFCLVFFFRSYTTVRFVRSEQKENIQIIREITNYKSMRHWEIKVTYAVDDNQLGCFVFENRIRKITAKWRLYSRS